MSNQPEPYRVYCFDSQLNMVTADWVDALSDEEAIAAAEAAGYGSKCEIWQGKRLVAQLSAERRQA